MTNAENDQSNEKKEMCPDQKNRFDALAVLWERAWKSIDERRGYEWKFAFGVWTALGLVIIGLLRQDIQSTDCTALLLSFAYHALPAVILIHLFWLCSLLRINRINIKIADHYQDKMLQMVDRDFIEELKRITEHWPDCWSIVCQIAITILLSVTVLVVLSCIHF